jgi:hypothetical protein
MRKTAKFTVVAASVAAFVLATLPEVAMARGGMGTGGTTKNATTCKSGKKVGDASKCKENGGKL